MADVISQPGLWKGFDLLRKDMSSPEMVVALAAMIFLRWADFQDAEQEAIAAFEGEPYEPVLPPQYHWRFWHQRNVSELEDFFARDLIAEIARSCVGRSDSLSSHLQSIAYVLKDFGQLSSESLGLMIDWLAEQPFETDHDRRILLDVFDGILDQSGGHQSAQHRTPKAIVQMMAALAAPIAEDRIYDPCFGTAGLLTAAADYVQKHEETKNSHRFVSAPTLCGRELKLNAFVIGLTRLVLSGVDDPQVDGGDSLEEGLLQSPQQDGFDLVVTNPPWGGRVDLRGLDYYPIKTKDATSLFIQHALFQLRPGGRAVVVVPQGFLFRQGPEQDLRKMLLEEHTVEAVVALPERAFAPYPNIGTSLLVFRRGGKTTDVHMVDGSFLFSSSRRTVAPQLSRRDLELLVDRVWNPEQDEYSWRVSAESLKEIDWDFTPTRRDQSALQSLLDQLRSSIEISPLNRCCGILSGRNIKSADLVDAPPEGTPVPYIRIRDVQNGQATKGSSWISTYVTGSVDLHLRLRAGDVLVSKSGTIGKVGIVRNGAVGAVATSGFYILRPDPQHLDPHFLVAYLNSAECRSWLNSKARGSVIRHLSKSAIEDVPVPLPSLQLQLRVAQAYRDHDEDALPFLSQLLLNSERDLITEWIEKITDFMVNFENASQDTSNLVPLDLLAKAVRKIRHEVSQETVDENPLGVWLTAFGTAVASLQGVQNIPKGLGLFSILQETIHKLKDADQKIMPNEAKARNLTRLISSWLDLTCSKLLEDVNLVFRSDVESLQADEMVEVFLEVQNLGALPLRDLQIETDFDWGGRDIGYLAEQRTDTVNLYIESPKQPGILTFDIQWSALTLDGQPVSGKRAFAFEVKEGNRGYMAESQNTGGSPYVCGDPVGPDRQEVFFGRDELLDQIRRQVIDTGNVVLLEGNRRSGKSSILCHLTGVQAISGWLGVNCSFQKAEGSKEGKGIPTVEVFRTMAKSIASSLYTNGIEAMLPDGFTMKGLNDQLSTDERFELETQLSDSCDDGISEDAPFSDFHDYLRYVLEKLEEHDLRLLLMLDEFEKLQEGIDSGITSPQVPENIRFLVQTYSRFTAILTGSRRLKRLREEYWSALYGLGTRFGVTSLPEEPARRLITEPIKNHFTYFREAVSRVTYLTAGQPYLLQCVCNRIFDMALQLKTRFVTPDLVDRACDVVVTDNEHFANLWDYAQSDRARLILVICHQEKDTTDLLRLGGIQERLFKYGVHVDDETLIADLEFLRELELIDLVGEASGGHYVLAIPLMGVWIEKHHDFAVILSKARSETEDMNE